MARRRNSGASAGNSVQLEPRDSSVVLATWQLRWREEADGRPGGAGTATAAQRFLGRRGHS